MNNRKITFLALLASATIVGRIFFQSLPNVQPVTAVLIFSTIYLGITEAMLLNIIIITISNIYLRRFFLNQEPEERNKYLDQNNELTSHFYEKYIITSWETSNKIDSLKTELTPE